MKTVGSLCIGDIVYMPTTKEIIESRITSLEVISPSYLIIIKCDSSSANSDSDHSKDIDHPQRSQTTYRGRYGDTICVNKDKAIRLQYEMRLKVFNERSKEITDKLAALQAMLMGWFQPNDPEKPEDQQ